MEFDEINIERTSSDENDTLKDVIGRAIYMGLNDQQIFEMYCKKVTYRGEKGLDIPRSKLRTIVFQIFMEWAQDEQERAPYLKPMAIRRILDHIRKAAQKEQWQAVASLEKVLGITQGTIEQPGVQKNLFLGDLWTDAVMKKIGKIDPDEYRAIIEEQKKILQSDQPQTINILPESSELVK